MELELGSVAVWGQEPSPALTAGPAPMGVCHEGAASPKWWLFMTKKLIKIKVEIKELSLLQSQAARAEKFICY